MYTVYSAIQPNSSFVRWRCGATMFMLVFGGGFGEKYLRNGRMAAECVRNRCIDGTSEENGRSSAPKSALCLLLLLQLTSTWCWAEALAPMHTIYNRIHKHWLWPNMPNMACPARFADRYNCSQLRIAPLKVRCLVENWWKRATTRTYGYRPWRINRFEFISHLFCSGCCQLIG